MSTVHIFRGGTLGIPVLANVQGSVASLLRACLVNGYNLPGVSSLTRAGPVATLTFSAPHNFFNTQYQIQISGATQTEYNGVFLATPSGTTSLDFTVAGTPATPATGAITARKTAAGWTTALDQGHTTLFRNNSVVGSGNYFRVKDDGWMHIDQNVTDFTHFAVTGARNFVTMTDLVTPFPRTITGTDRHSNDLHGACTRKMFTTDQLDWMVVADSQTCYWVVNHGNETFFTDTFGDIRLMAAIVTNPRSIVAGSITYSVSDRTTFRSHFFTAADTNPQGCFLVHPLTGGAQSTQFRLMDAVGTVNPGGMRVNPPLAYSHKFPSPITGGAVFEKIYICDDTNNVVRTSRHTNFIMERFAQIRGLHRCTHSLNGVLGDIGSPLDIVRAGGRDYLLLYLPHEVSGGTPFYGAHAFDLTGPW